MNRCFVNLAPYIALVIVAAVVTGCANVMPLSIKVQNADRKFEAAQGMNIRADTPENKKADLAKRKELYDTALTGYLEIIAADPHGKYSTYSHFQAAAIYKKRFEWDKSTEHYQAIVDMSPAGYLGGRAKSSIADIRKNREVIRENRRTYQNHAPLSKDLAMRAKEATAPEDIELYTQQAQDSNDKAVRALYDEARAYQTLGNSEEAIKQFERVVTEFPEHRLAPQAQFQVGNIYFYELYDYIGGWPAYIKVIEKFPDSYEASDAETLLKESETTLTEIAQDQADIKKYTNQKALAYLKAGRKVLPSDLYVAGYADRIAQNFQNIGSGWVKLRNYPSAIVAYRTLAENLSYKKFHAADALFRIGDLYQKDGQYQRAIAAFQDMLDKAPESTWRDEAVYQQAVCFRAVREFEEAYRGFKAYMSLDKEGKYYREAEQIVRQYELDQDGDGFQFYVEQEAGTSDKDPNDNPDVKEQQAEAAEDAQTGGE
jgi:tetratricopeptide (TPR) repeat protein